MQTNFIERATLLYALDPVVQLSELTHLVSHAIGEDVNVQQELQRLRLEYDRRWCNLDMEEVAEKCPEEREKQLPFLILKACEVLRSLQRSLVNYSKRQMHDEIASLRATWSATGKDPPTAVFCNGTWNRQAPGRGSFGSAWHRASHRRATNRNFIRRAKQIHWHRQKRRDGRSSKVTNNILASVSIESKPISEIRSTKQKLSFSTLLSQQRIDNRAPPRSLFPALSKDRPWKLRWAKGDTLCIAITPRAVPWLFLVCGRDTLSLTIRCRS